MTKPKHKPKILKPVVVVSEDEFRDIPQEIPETPSPRVEVEEQAPPVVEGLSPFAPQPWELPSKPRETVGRMESYYDPARKCNVMRWNPDRGY